MKKLTDLQQKQNLELLSENELNQIVGGTASLQEDMELVVEEMDLS